MINYKKIYVSSIDNKIIDETYKSLLKNKWNFVILDVNGVLNVLTKYTRDYDLIYIVISYIRALILQASDKEIFIMAINDLLADDTYKPIHQYLSEILKKLEEDRQIPIYINVKVQNGRY